MKAIRTSNPWRGWVLPVLALASMCWLIPGIAPAQQPPVEKKELPAPPKPPTQMEVFKLRYVLPTELAQMIHEIVGTGQFGQLRLSADGRTNCLIVVATPDDMALIKTLISKMDISEGKGKEEIRTKPTVRVFPLQYTRADNAVERALRLIFPGNNFSVDSNRNVVTVTGDQKTLEEAARLIERLDRPQGKPRIPEMQVRLVWLASGLKEGRKPPEDMKAVVAELEKMGIEEPRLVTQTLVTALPDKQFRMEGLVGLDSPYQLSVSGILLGGRIPGEIERLQISIHATSPATISGVPFGRLDTEITAPLGHSVVLGVTPTATSTSAFVVQILPKR